MVKVYENESIDDIIKLLDISSRPVIFYGAGKYADMLLNFLDIKGKIENVKYCVVSEIKENSQMLHNKKVCLLDDVSGELANTNIIVATGAKFCKEIIETLRNYSTGNIYTVSASFIGEIDQELLKREQQKIFSRYSMLPIQNNKIFFYCYKGNGYRCNCKYIAEALLAQEESVEIVWAIIDESIDNIPKEIKTVIIGTEEYYYEFYTSHVWISNSWKDTKTLKREGQFYINTWHGYGPFKKTNAALYAYNPEIEQKIFEYFSCFNLFVSASRFYTQVYRDSFCYRGEIYEAGAPRNDVFFVENNYKTKVYENLGIPEECKMVLFAPTYRNDLNGSFECYLMNIDKVCKALEMRFGGKFVFVCRFHHMLYNIPKCRETYENAINATFYPDVQELLVAADVVITDYSSLMWDFSLQRKPVFLYQPDRCQYEKQHGFYSSISEWPYPKSQNQEELENIIKRFDEKIYQRELNVFLDKYGSCDDGHATERVVRRVLEVINI